MQISSSDGFPNENGVKVVSRCVLEVVDRDWPFAETNKAQIDAHWQKATASNPSYFNGIVYLGVEAHSAGNELHANFIRAEFKGYLYWRSLGFPDAGVIDGFGAALIRSSDGYYMLALQRAGNVNHGFAYLPSGFIDERDILPDRMIDIDLSVQRELDEEIGEAGGSLKREEGIIVARSGAQLCFAVPFSSPKTAEDLIAGVEAHNAALDDPELEGVIPAGSLEDIEPLKILPYARLLLEAVFVAR